MVFTFQLFSTFKTKTGTQNERECCTIKRSTFRAHCCGIVGYLGHGDTNEILLHGIKAMKSRGYDSCGVCTLDEGKLKVTKCCSVGTPADSYSILKKKVLSTHRPSMVGIGHTRWATVGKPSDKNSHPHVDLSGSLALVHNGTISNVEEIYNDYFKDLVRAKLRGGLGTPEKRHLKSTSDGLLGAGVVDKHDRTSDESGEFKLPDSDTESVAIFLGLEYEKVGDLFTAFKNTIKRLKGTWALCMMSTHYPDSLFVAAHEAPLLVARSETGIFVGSEPTVFMNYVNDCIALEDGQVFELSLANVEAYYRRSKLLKLEQEVIEDSHEPYPNWYTKELSDQVYLGRIIISFLNAAEQARIGLHKLGEHLGPILKLTQRYAGTDNLSVLGGDVHYENTLLSKVKIADIGFTFDGLRPDVCSRLKRTRRLLFVACGTSLHAAKYVVKILQKLNFFESVEADDASDLTLYRYYDKDNTVVYISNSGETLDCILALNYIKKINPHCLSVSLINTLHSSLERASDATIHLRIGREKAVPSTKAFTAQVLVLLMLALYIMETSPVDEVSTSSDSSDPGDTQYESGLDDHVDEFTQTPSPNLMLGGPEFQEKYVEHYGSSENYSIRSLYKSLSAFPCQVEHMLKENEVYDRIARKLVNEKIVYILGRGCGHVVALEASLKMKEVAYIQAEGVLSGAMKHGFYAMIIEKDRTPTISIITSEDKEMTINSTMQLKARGSFIIVVTDITEDLEFADIVVRMPSVGALTAALAVVPMQIITSKIALLANRDPDIPRGLAKTVTTL